MKPLSKRKQEALVMRINNSYPVGGKVKVEQDNGDVLGWTIKAPASMLGGHTAVIWTEEHSSCYLATRVKFDKADAKESPAPLLPSNFATQPWNSVFQKSEHETVAANIMTILKRTGNTWRPLGFDEYRKERLKDGNFSELEKGYFDEVKVYCISAEQANLFAKNWAKLNN